MKTPARAISAGSNRTGRLSSAAISASSSSRRRSTSSGRSSASAYSDSSASNSASRMARRADFLVAHLDGFAFELAQAVGMAVGEVDGDRDPFPAFGGQGLGFLLQLVMDQAVEQGRVLQPAAAIVLEKIAGDLAAGRLIGLDADKRGAAVIGGWTAVSVSMRRI